MYSDRAEENIYPGSITSTISQRIQKMFIHLDILRELFALFESKRCHEKWDMAT
jgi:hypothetical protein